MLLRGDSHDSLASEQRFLAIVWTIHSPCSSATVSDDLDEVLRIAFAEAEEAGDLGARDLLEVMLVHVICTLKRESRLNSHWGAHDPVTQSFVVGNDAIGLRGTVM